MATTAQPTQYTMSRNGILFIARREALVLVAYQDGPHKSIGFGHNNPKLKDGDRIDAKQAFALLREDVKAREKRVSDLLKVPVTQNQFDAIMSLHYQSGNRYMPAVVALVNAKELKVAAELFPLCDRNLAGEEIDGLRKRRELEVKVFVDGNYGDDLLDIPFWEGNPRSTPRKVYHVQPGDL